MKSKVKSVIKQFTAWSYSRWRDYKRCPAYAKFRYLDKLPEGPESPQMARGTAIHKIAEDYVRGAIEVFPTELKPLKKFFVAARAVKGVLTEEQWNFDSKWEVLPPMPEDFSSFTDRDWANWRRIWFRMKTDLHVVDRPTNVLVVVDHKTGKYKEHELESYYEQLELTALSGMHKYPDVAGVSPRLWYVDEGLQHGEDLFFPRRDHPRLIKIWGQRAQQMFTDTKFKPKPNAKCKWCHYRKANGGPCEY